MNPSPQNDPKKTIAVLIGVEKYDVGKSWNLNGPANDVRHFSEWLQEQGVPAEQLYFFLSPLVENLPLSAHLQTKPADENTIFKFLTNELPTLAEQAQCRILFFFWSGHGSITADQQNRLFCSDATEKSKLHINLDSLLQMARSTLYAKLTQQIFIIDACANYFESMRYKATLPDRSFPYEMPLATIVQEALFAAAPGQITQNDNLRNIGEFSDFLLTTLKKHTSTAWPLDLTALHQATIQLAKQKSFYLHLKTGDKEYVEGSLPLPQPSRLPFDRPPRAVHFQDRKKDLDQLLTDLQPGYVVTLCGPGGIGKTALAAEAIWRLAETNDLAKRFPDGILFHTFYGQPQAELAFQYIATSYAEALQTTPAQTARRALAGRQALLVLDGAEDADDLDAVLAIRGRCGVLVTSRSRKDAIAERADITPLPPVEAIALLQAWGGQRAADQQTAHRICELVGELPLAVRLAGSYLREAEMNAAEYLRVFLERTPLTALHHENRQHESVPLLLERSVQRVSEQARQVLGVVGVLAFAPFTAEAITAALTYSEPETWLVLGELVRYSLLSRPENSYEVTHRLVHTYAREKLAPSQQTVVQLASYYTTFIKTHSSEFVQLHPIRPHALTLLQRCSEQQAWSAVDSLAQAIDSYLDLQGYWRDGITVIEAGLQAARANQNRRDEGVWLGNLGYVYRNLGQVKQAIGYYQQALAIAKAIGDRRGEGNHLGNLGLAYADLGQVEQAIGYYEQALAIAKESDDRRNEGAWLGNLGLAYVDLGKVEQAIECHEQALAISKAIGDRRGEGNHLGNLGLAYRNLGRVKPAIECHEQALAISKAIGDRRGEGNHLGNLGLAYADLGQVEQGIGYHQQALAIAKAIGYRRGEGNHLGNLGLAYADLGQMEQAIEYHQQALAIAKEIGDRRNEGAWLGNLGLVYAALGQMEQAIDYYQQALAIAKAIGDRRNEGAWLGNLGLVYAALGQMEQAIDYYQQALAIAKAIGHRRGEGNHLGNLGLAYADLGQVEQAIDYYQQALAISKEIGDRSGEGADLGNLGNAYTDLGEIEKAIVYYRRALDISQEIRDRRGEGNHLSNLGNAYRNLGQVKQAREYWQTALQVFEQIKSPRTNIARQWLSSLQKE